MSPEVDTRELVEMLRARLPGLLAIYAFGSYGTGARSRDSDLDLAIYAGAPLPSYEVWRASVELAELAGRDVDLVDLGAATTVMRARVISTGERLWCARRPECETFEDYAYSAYARLQEERRDILKDVLSRGSVHGR